MNTRKHPRLKGYDYSQNGAYFVTFCTKERRKILSRIVGPDALIGPLVELTPYGKLLEDAIQGAVLAYPNVSIPCYVIMPNHVHLLVVMERSGPMGASGPTLGMVVRSMKPGSPVRRDILSGRKNFTTMSSAIMTNISKSGTTSNPTRPNGRRINIMTAKAQCRSQEKKVEDHLL